MQHPSKSNASHNYFSAYSRASFIRIVSRIGQNEFCIIYRLDQDKNVVFLFLSLFFRDNEHGLKK